MVVKVIDAMMGSGKTSAMLNYINGAPATKKFIFVTPYLDEGQRLMDYCQTKEFVTPSAYDDPEHPGDQEPRSKMIDVKAFLANKKNIVTTHALFENFDAETLQLISDGHYTLIIDEVPNIVEKLDVTPWDAKRIVDSTDQDSNGMLIWKQEEQNYRGLFLKYKFMADAGWLWYYGPTSVISMFPPELFTSFDDVFLMTYLFDAQFQRCYFDLFDIPYEKWYVAGSSPETYHITPVPQPQRTITDLRNLIHICYEKKLNQPYATSDQRSMLARGWYERHMNTQEMANLKNNTYNYFRHICSAKSTDVLWTTFRQRVNKYQRVQEGQDPPPPYFTPRGYSLGFLACNARATNKFRHKTVLAYLINRFPTPEVQGFFSSRGIKVERDRWALSEMIQWIWRSAIRDGKEIWIYIPSLRMRTLLEKWIDEVSGETAAA